MCFRVVMALHIKSMSSPMSSHKIAAYFHRPFETPSVCVCVLCPCKNVCECTCTCLFMQRGVGGAGRACEV